MANGDARFTFHNWADIPVDRWGKPVQHPHHINGGRGDKYTPHQAFVTAAFVLVGDEAHPIEKDVCRIVGVDPANVTLVVGPDDSSPLVQLLTKKLHGTPTAMRVGVWARFVPSYEIGNRVIADETFKPFKVGLPVSLMEEKDVR